MTLIRDKGKAGQTAPPAAETLVSYEADAYTWALQQADLLRAAQFDRIDAHNIADEIADVARREAEAARSALRLVLQHLLKWDSQPDRRSRSWMLTVRTQRRTVERVLAENPGLRACLPVLIAEAYVDARDDALQETELPESVLPTTCTYSLEDILNRAIIWPDPS